MNAALWAMTCQPIFEEGFMKRGDVVMTKQPCMTFNQGHIEAARLFVVESAGCSRGTRAHVEDQGGEWCYRHCLAKRDLVVLEK